MKAVGVRSIERTRGIPVVMQRAAAAQDLQHSAAQQQATTTGRADNARERRRVRRRGGRKVEKKEKGREGEGGKEEKEREIVEERDKEAKKDVMDWTAVRKNKRQRKRTVQIFVKVDGMDTVQMVSPEDKVQKILNTVSGSGQEVYGRRHGRALRRSEKLKSCGVVDGCTTQVTSKMRRGALRVWWFSRVRRTK